MYTSQRTHCKLQKLYLIFILLSLFFHGIFSANLSSALTVYALSLFLSLCLDLLSIKKLHSHTEECVYYISVVEDIFGGGTKFTLWKKIVRNNSFRKKSQTPRVAHFACLSGNSQLRVRSMRFDKYPISLSFSLFSPLSLTLSSTPLSVKSSARRASRSVNAMRFKREARERKGGEGERGRER